jgi:ribosomal protein S12 methylthiotransferase accessory factor
MRNFYDKFEVETDSIAGNVSRKVLDTLRGANLEVKVWRCPRDHNLPVYLAHVFERTAGDLAPLPADGSGCHFSDDWALARALLEACSARVTAISGAREDITREQYPEHHDFDQLTTWKRHSQPATSTKDDPSGSSFEFAFEGLIKAFKEAGARAILVVPLYSSDSPPIHVVRVVAPPLKGLFQ